MLGVASPGVIRWNVIVAFLGHSAIPLSRVTNLSHFCDTSDEEDQNNPDVYSKEVSLH